VRRCDAAHPKILAHYTPEKISQIQQLVALASGTVDKVNHITRGIIFLQANARLAANDPEFDHQDQQEAHVYRRKTL